MENIQKEVKILIDNHVNDIFIKMQDKLGISSGDIEPFQELKLDEVKEELTKIISEIIELEIQTNL